MCTLMPVRLASVLRVTFAFGHPCVFLECRMQQKGRIAEACGLFIYFYMSILYFLLSAIMFCVNLTFVPLVPLPASVDKD